jgi:hypothetical protein
MKTPNFMHKKRYNLSSTQRKYESYGTLLIIIQGTVKVNKYPKIIRRKKEAANYFLRLYNKCWGVTNRPAKKEQKSRAYSMKNL